MNSRWRAIVLIAVHVAIGIHIWHWQATGESMSPVEPSEAMQTIELGKINAGFLLFAGLIASTVIFGRWFCGWACHVVALPSSMVHTPQPPPSACVPDRCSGGELLPLGRLRTLSD